MYSIINTKDAPRSGKPKTATTSDETNEKIRLILNSDRRLKENYFEDLDKSAYIYIIKTFQKRFLINYHRTLHPTPTLMCMCIFNFFNFFYTYNTHKYLLS